MLNVAHIKRRHFVLSPVTTTVAIAAMYYSFTDHTDI